MSYIGTNQPNNVLKNTGIYTPNEILQLTKEGSWGGSLELTETVTADDSVTYYDFDNLGSYDVHLFQAINIQSASTTAQNLDIRVKVGGTAQSSGYHFAQQLGNDAGTFSESNSTSFSQFIWLPNVDNETDASANGYAYIYSAIDSSKYTTGTFSTCITQGTNVAKFSYGGNVFTTANQCSGLRVFLATTGNIASGTIKLYGIKQI